MKNLLPSTFLILFASFLISGCQNTLPDMPSFKKDLPRVEERVFGKVDNGRNAYLYTLTNTKGMKVEVTNYGATVVSLTAPDRNGIYEDVVLGFKDLEGYMGESNPYFGCIVGRYANRIANGKFILNDRVYTLNQNNGVNSLHGGPQGFHKRIWNAKAVRTYGSIGVEMKYVSNDMEEGFPGTVEFTVSYHLTNNNELIVRYSATTDKATVFNPTHHSYFNLAGAGSGDILGHELTIYANAYTPVNKNLVPTGALAPVKNTPFDFTTSKAIGKDINKKDNVQLTFGGGYDHNFVIKRQHSTDMVLAAEVHEPVSGRTMKIFSTDVGLQFYTGNFLDGSIKGKDDKIYHKRTGFCLEPQCFPDSPNQKHFPSATLRPEQTYTKKTVFAFSAK